MDREPRPEPDYHFIPKEFLEKLQGEIGSFDLKKLTNDTVTIFGAKDFELQEWGTTLRFNLYQTPDIQKHSVIHIEIWMNQQGSGKAELRVYINLEEIDLDKVGTVVEKYGGKITGKAYLGRQVEIPFDLQKGRIEEMGKDAKTIYDEVVACSK